MTEQMNVPELRFGEFSGLWDQKSISEVATKVTDGTHDTPKPVESGIPYITAIHVKDGAINFDNCYYVEPEVHKVIYKRCNPEKGDLLLVNIGSGTATCAINTCDDEFSMKNVALIKPNREMLEPYFLEQIQRKSTARLFHRLTSGGAQPFFSLKEIKKLTHYYPTLPEQQKIASFLSKVDEKIGLLSEKKDKLTEYKRGVMQQLFNGKWQVQDGQLTFVPPTLRFKADDGSEFPDWEEKRLGSLADLTSSKRVYLSDYTEEGIPFFRGKEISELRKGIIPEDILYITQEAFDEFKRKFGAPVEGDILITAVGTLANILRVSGDFEFYFKDGNLIWLRNPSCDSRFLSILMEANKNDILKTAIGSSQKALTIVELKKITFNMPSLFEQKKITMFLSSLEDKLSLANSELSKAKEWKRGLLQQMFV